MVTKQNKWKQQINCIQNHCGNREKWKKASLKRCIFLICGLAYWSVSSILTRKKSKSYRNDSKLFVSTTQTNIPKEERDQQASREDYNFLEKKGNPRRTLWESGYLVGKTKMDGSREVRMDRSKNRNLRETISHWRHPCVWWALSTWAWLQ